MIHISRARRLRRMDWIMASVVLVLTGIGLASIYSAGFAGSDPTITSYYHRQFMWAGAGMLLFLGFASADYHAWTRMAWPLYAAGVILLALVLLPQFGHSVYGARRWIQVAGVRLMQPSELMKPALIILFARIFGWPDRNSAHMRIVAPALILAVLPMMLIVRQPDVGTALVFVPVVGAMMFAAGVQLRLLGALAATAILLFSILLGLVLIPHQLEWSEERQERIWSSFGMSSYQRDRILVFFDNNRDPLGAGWNKAQSEIAVGSGGLRGKGYLKGTQNVLGFLPRTVAPTDFVFSVIAEEKGFAGAALVLLLFALLVGRCLRAAAFARDKAGFLLCVGVAALLFSHAFINIGMTIGLLPITGTPLPLVSYGGTFTLSVMSALGVVQSVYIRGDRNKRWKGF